MVLKEKGMLITIQSADADLPRPGPKMVCAVVECPFEMPEACFENSWSPGRALAAIMHADAGTPCFTQH
jgi:hypothetical protein